MEEILMRLSSLSASEKEEREDGIAGSGRGWSPT